MFEGYATGDPTEVSVDDDFILKHWPEKGPDDVGSVYVGIVGDDFVEGVTVVISKSQQGLLIRSVDWGRP